MRFGLFDLLRGAIRCCDFSPLQLVQKSRQGTVHHFLQAPIRDLMPEQVLRTFELGQHLLVCRELDPV